MTTFGDLRSLLQQRDPDEAALIELLRAYTDPPEPAGFYVLDTLGYVPITLWRPESNPRYLRDPLVVMRMVESATRLRDHESHVIGAINIGSKVCPLHTLKTPLADIQQVLLPIRQEALRHIQATPTQRANLERLLRRRCDEVHDDKPSGSIKTMLSSIYAWESMRSPGRDRVASIAIGLRNTRVIQEVIPELADVAALMHHPNADPHFSKTIRHLNRALAQLHMPRFQP
jgi:hypothetical protein